MKTTRLPVFSAILTVWMITFHASPVLSQESLATFAVMGDVPYGLTEKEIAREKALLRGHIEGLNQEEAIEFVVHVGDIKKGAPPCEPKVYEDVALILRQSKHPLFILPGDNEWNDCLNPDEAWRLWTAHFLRFETNWTHSLEVTRQVEQPENFAFIRNGVLFVGLNLVGGKVHDAEEWKNRISNNLKWIESQFKKEPDLLSSAVIFFHANPGIKILRTMVFSRQEYRPLMRFLDEDTEELFPKPILIIHGDGHVWIEDHPFPNAGKRITRVQVTQGGLEAPLRVTITNHPDTPFQLIRKTGP